MFHHDATDPREGANANRIDTPSQTISDMVSPIANWSPALSPRTHSFDSIASQRSQPLALPSTCELQRRSNSSPASSSAHVASPLPSQPQAILNMRMIQAQAELLEMQTRRDMEETQRLAERHFEEMLDSKGFRVTHACEHCRQRKAKCSGQQPCQRCAKQGILCMYSKQDRRGKMFGQMHSFTDVPSQSSRYSMHGLGAAANVGPMRAEKSRELRYANTSIPYGPRRNTAPSIPLEYASITRDVSSSSSVPPPPTVSSVMPLLPPATRLHHGGRQFPAHPVRPTPLRFSGSLSGEERRNLHQNTSDASLGNFNYGQGPYMQTRQPDSPQADRNWSTESSPHPSDLQLRYSPSSARCLDVPTSRAALSSTLNSMWSEEDALSVPCSDQRNAFQPAPYRTTLLDQTQMSGIEDHESIRRGSWSIDGEVSQIVRRGSLPTEGRPPQSGDPPTPENSLPPFGQHYNSEDHNTETEQPIQTVHILHDHDKC